MLNIRPCTPKDLRSVSDIAAKYTSFDAKPTFADIEGMYARNPDCFFVAETNPGQIIGFITGHERKGIPDEVLRAWNARRVGYVELMAVETDYRRRGVGNALMKTLLEHFKRKGVDAVNLDVPVAQEAAVALYRKMGFQARSHSMTKRLT